MRTTVDLPPAVHARARALARERRTSLSSVVADLAVRGLAGLDDGDARISTDLDTGWPVLSIGQELTAPEVDELLDDE